MRSALQSCAQVTACTNDQHEMALHIKRSQYDLLTESRSGYVITPDWAMPWTRCRYPWACASAAGLEPRPRPGMLRGLYKQAGTSSARLQHCTQFAQIQSTTQDASFRLSAQANSPSACTALTSRLDLLGCTARVYVKPDTARTCELSATLYFSDHPWQQLPRSFDITECVWLTNAPAIEFDRKSNKVRR